MSQTDGSPFISFKERQPKRLFGSIIAWYVTTRYGTSSLLSLIWLWLNACPITNINGILLCFSIPFLISTAFIFFELNDAFGTYDFHNWVDSDFCHKVSYADALDRHSIYQQQWLFELNHNRRLWCKKNCKGRWQVKAGHAIFSRKTDAVLFALHQPGLGSDS